MSAAQPPPPDDPTAAQAAVAHTRDGLLNGRGPGAPPEEIALHTHDRSRLGGQPVAQQRAALAHQTAIARGHADALVENTTRVTNPRGNAIPAIPRRTDAAKHLPVRLQTVLAAVATSVVAVAIVVNHKRRNR